VGASGGPTEPTAASTTTTASVLVGASSVVAVQAFAAAKSSDAGGGGSVGADVTKAQKPGISQQEECVVGVAPEEEEAEKVAASGAMHDAPGAKYAIGGGMTIGGQFSEVGASGGPTGQRCLRRRLQRQQSKSSSGQALYSRFKPLRQPKAAMLTMVALLGQMS